VRVPVESLAELRRQPGPVSGKPLPASLLKHADEQTVAGLAAVYHAIHDHGLSNMRFADWGVVAAPFRLGRGALAAALQRFRDEGAWGVSPHLIPHRSLHSVSGTVSHALKIHGPNFGAGGGPGAAAEAMLAAVAMLERQRIPGVWVILCALDPELPPLPDGRLAPQTFCVGQALALCPSAARAGTRLRIVAEREEPGPILDPFQLKDRLDQLAVSPITGLTLRLSLGSGMCLELSRVVERHAGENGAVNGVRRNGHAAHQPHGAGETGIRPPALATRFGAETER
jgi:hypothetical protein